MVATTATMMSGSNRNGITISISSHRHFAHHHRRGDCNRCQHRSHQLPCLQQNQLAYPKIKERRCSWQGFSSDSLVRLRSLASAIRAHLRTRLSVATETIRICNEFGNANKNVSCTVRSAWISYPLSRQVLS